jgi:hypothetical protein
VYRFGGYELSDKQAKAVTIKFFEQLFAKHAVSPVPSR